MDIILRLWSKYYFVFLDGLKGTLWLASVTVFFGTLLGILIALIGMSKNKFLNTILKVYI